MVVWVDLHLFVSKATTLHLFNLPLSRQKDLGLKAVLAPSDWRLLVSSPFHLGGGKVTEVFELQSVCNVLLFHFATSYSPSKRVDLHRRHHVYFFAWRIRTAEICTQLMEFAATFRSSCVTFSRFCRYEKDSCEKSYTGWTHVSFQGLRTENHKGLSTRLIGTFSIYDAKHEK